MTGYFNLALAGHRIITELDRITCGIDTALESIRRANSGQSLRLLSTLCEGAEQLLVQQILNAQAADLIVVLPMPRDVYRSNFTTEDARLGLDWLMRKASKVIELPVADSSQSAFQASNAYMLEHCDTLLVIWDGKTAQSIGGTGELAFSARHRRLPLVWIHAGNRQPGTFSPTSLGDEQGMVSFERFDQAVG